MLRSGNEEMITEKLRDGLKSYYLEVEKIQAEIKAENAILSAVKTEIDQRLNENRELKKALASAQDMLSKAESDARNILEEATRVAAQKVADATKELDFREKQLQDERTFVANEAAKLRQAETDFRIKSDGIGEREANLIEAEADLKEHKAVADAQADKISAAMIELSKKEKDCVAFKEQLDDRQKTIDAKVDDLIVQSRELRAGRVQLEADKTELEAKREALAHFEAEIETFKKEKLEYQDLRDKLFARELALNEYEARLNIDRNDLLEREKLNTAKAKGE